MDARLQDPTDPLSPLARRLLKLDPGAYASLTPSSTAGNAIARDLLQSAQPQDLLTAPMTSRDDARALLAGLWLWFDWLDESHRISQGIDTPSGSYWHAIMHRREGDFGNSKYWLARCRSHPAMTALAAQAASVVNSFPADKSLLRIVMNGWNPDAFVDLVETVHESPNDPRHRVAVSLQRLEWQTLFDHCTRTAVG
jgi:hypothetical protein